MTTTPTELTAAKEGPDEAYTDAQVETVRRVYEQWPEFRPSPEAGARDTRHLLGAIARLREELATAQRERGELREILYRHAPPNTYTIEMHLGDLHLRKLMRRDQIDVWPYLAKLMLKEMETACGQP